MLRDVRLIPSSSTAFPTIFELKGVAEPRCRWSSKGTGELVGCSKQEQWARFLVNGWEKLSDAGCRVTQTLSGWSGSAHGDEMTFVFTCGCGETSNLPASKRTTLPKCTSTSSCTPLEETGIRWQFTNIKVWGDRCPTACKLKSGMKPAKPIDDVYNLHTSGVVVAKVVCKFVGSGGSTGNHVDHCLWYENMIDDPSSFALIIHGSFQPLDTRWLYEMKAHLLRRTPSPFVPSTFAWHELAEQTFGGTLPDTPVPWIYDHWSHKLVTAPWGQQYWAPHYVRGFGPNAPGFKAHQKICPSK